MIDWMNNAGKLSPAELIWLLAWNIAAGNWDRIGLPPEKAREFFFDFVGKLSGDPLMAAENSRVQLQRGLTASREAPNEEIQLEPPFDDRARHNLELLLSAWKNGGQRDLARAWHEIFSAPVKGSGGPARANVTLPEPTAAGEGLSDTELAWLIAWNAAAGAWDRIGLSTDEAKQALLHFMRCMLVNGDGLKAVKESRIWLRQSLMALRRESFEAIQSEAPFNRDTLLNFEALARAWQEAGEQGVTQKWNEIFAPGWQERRHSHAAVRVVGGPGDSEERALEVVGAPDRETRIAAEYWYLYYTYGRNWKGLMHATVNAEKGDRHFSMHEICILPDRRKRIYFRLPW